MSKDPNNKGLIKKIQGKQPLTQKDKATINKALGNINNNQLTNTNAAINSNNLTIFNKNTSSNVANILAGLGGLFVGIGAAMGGGFAPRLRHGWRWSVWWRLLLAARLPFCLLSQQSRRFRTKPDGRGNRGPGGMLHASRGRRCCGSHA